MSKVFYPPYPHFILALFIVPETPMQLNPASFSASLIFSRCFLKTQTITLLFLSLKPISLTSASHLPAMTFFSRLKFSFPCITTTRYLFLCLMLGLNLFLACFAMFNQKLNFSYLNSTISLS